MNIKQLLISTFIFIIFIAMTSSTFAQDHHKVDAYAKHPQHELLKALKTNTTASGVFRQPQKNTIATQKKTSGIQKSGTINSKLQAVCLLQHDGVMFIPADSLRFFWSGDNEDGGFTDMILNAFIGLPTNTPFVPSPDPLFILSADSTRSYSWYDADGVYKLSSKTYASFDSQGNLASLITLETPDNIIWENSDRKIYTYDTQGNCLNEIAQLWSGSVWENYKKQEFTFDSQNNMTEIKWTYWNNSTSSWLNYERTVMSYEGANKINSLIEQTWNEIESSWSNEDRYSVIYTGANVSQVISDYWSNGQSQWVHESKTVNTYNTNNQLTIVQELEWDIANQEWNNEWKQLFNYDEIGDNTNIIDQYWDGGAWNYQFKFEYTYSAFDITKATISDWDGTQFNKESRVSYSYNDYSQCTKVIIEGWDGNDWTPSLYSLKINFYYEETGGNTTGIETIMDRSEFKIYPNPASDHLKVKLNGQEIQQIRIIDVTGRMVFESRAGFNASEANIPVSHLQNGVYILQLTSGNKTGTNSFVVSH